MPRKERKEVGEKKKKEIDKDGAKPYSDAETPAPVLTDQEKTIVDLVQQGVYLVDDIMAWANLSAGAILAALTMLEIKGVVTRLPGKRVTLK